MPLDRGIVQGSLADHYDAVSSIANGGSPAYSLQQARQQQPALQQVQQPNMPMREMNGGEQLFANIANFGRSLAESSGFGQYYQDNGGLASLASPEGLGRFVMNLPTGMASALPTGVANLYAGLTGSNVTYGADVSNNLIQEEQLDLGQRVASGVTGLIDTAGLAVGGSGSLLNEIGRAWKAGKGVEAARSVGAGARAFSGSGSSMVNKGIMTPGQAFAFDVAEEAGEEAVQSVSEDVIQKQLDEGSVGRAFEGAVMGALGGAMMSGGALALRSATESDIRKAAPQQQQAGDVHDPYSYYQSLISSNEADGRIFIPEDARKVQEQRQLKKFVKPVEGSMMAQIVNSGEITTVDDIVPGIEELRYIWIQSRNAEDQLLAFFNGGWNNLVRNRDGSVEGATITRADLWNHLNNGSQADAMALTGVLDRVYGRRSRKVACLRNPATTNGAVWVNVKSIGTGRGFDMSGNTAQVLGGDFDGDRVALFFDIHDADFDPQMWASAFTMGDEPGGLAFDWRYGSAEFNEDPNQVANMRAQLRQVLTSLRASGSNVLSNDVINTCIDLLVNSYSRFDPNNGRELSNDARNRNISQALAAVNERIGEGYRSIFPDGDVTGNQRIAINRVISALAGKKVTPLQAAQQAANGVISELDELIKRGDKTGSDFFSTPGSSGHLGTAASGFQSGVLGHYTASELDQFYRNYATMVYNYVKSHETEIASEFGVDNAMSAFGRLVLYGCHVVNRGAEPVKTVTGIIDRILVDEFRAAWGVGDQLHASLDVDERDKMMQAFVKAYNDLVPTFEECRKVLINGSLTESYMMPPRRKINLDEKDGKLRFGSEFMRLLGSEQVTRFIPESMLSADIDSGMTLADAIILASQRDLKFGFDALFGGKDKTGEFFDMLVRSQKAEGSRIQARVLEAYREFAPGLKGIRERFAQNGVLDERDVEAMRAFTNWIYSVLNVDAAYTAQLLDPERWSRSEIGRLIMSGNEEQFLNACTIINWGGKFDKFLVHIHDHPGVDFDEAELAELDALASIDVIHKEIVDSLRNKGENNQYSVSSVLEMILDGSIPFYKKQSNIESMFRGLDATIGNRLYLSGVAGTPDMTTCVVDDSLTTRMKQGMSYLSQYRRALYDSNLKDAKTIKRMFVDNPQESGGTKLTTIMNRALRFNRFKVSMKPLSILMADMANVTNHQAEKGTANDLAGSFFIMVDVAANGAQSSFDADTFSAPFGNYMLVDLAQNYDLLFTILSDPTFSITVFDENGDSCEFNRDALLMECSPTYREMRVKEVNDMVWCDLFMRLPNILSYLGGVEMSFASGTDGIKSSLSKSGTFVGYCRDQIAADNERITTFGESQARKMQQFYDAADTIASMIMTDNRMAKYVFAALPQHEQVKAMSGIEPNYHLMWKAAQDLARAIAALKIRGGGSCESVMDFTNQLRRQLYDRVEHNIKGVYDAIVANARNDVGIDAMAMGSIFGSVMDDAMVAACLPMLDGLQYSYNGETRTFSSTSTEGVNGNLIWNNVQSAYMTLSDSAVEIFGIMALTRSSLEAVSSRDNNLFNTLERLLRGSFGDEGGAIAGALHDEIMRQGIDNIENELLSGAGVNNIVLGRNDSTLFGGRLDNARRSAFLDKLEALGRFSHDSRFVEYARRERQKLTDPSTRSFECGEAKDLYDAYVALFSETNGEWLGPADSRTSFTALESLIVKFSNKAIAYSISRHSMQTGKMNPYEMSDSYEFISMIEDFVQDEDINTFWSNEVGKSDGSIDVDRFLYNLNLPDVRYSEASAYMNQLMEAVSAGRVISTVGINGSELMKTAALSFVPEDRVLPFRVDNPRTGQQLREMLEAGTLDVMSHVVLADGTMAVCADVIANLGDGETVQLLERKINPHGIHYGPQPEPQSNSYGVRYKTTLGLLNKLHMLGMENLVLKIRKEFGGDSAFVKRKRRGYVYEGSSGPTPVVDFDSRDTFLAGARAGYEAFCLDAADKIFKNSDYRGDLEKAHIGADDLLGIVQMMTVGFTITYSSGVDEHGNEILHQTTVDVMHLYDGQLDAKIGELIGNGTFKSASLFVIPLQTISTRVNNAVFNVTNEEPTEEDLADAAYKAMTEWDGYEPNRLSATSVARRFSALGRSHTNVIAERSATPLQNLIDKIFPTGTDKGITFENPWGKLNTVTLSRSNQDRRAQEFFSINDSILTYPDNDLTTRTDVCIVNVFGLTGEPARDFGFDPANPGDYNYGYLHSQLRKLRSENEIVQVSDPNVKRQYVVCLTADTNSEEFRNASMFAAATGARILIPSMKRAQVPCSTGQISPSDVMMRIDNKTKDSGARYISFDALELSPASKDMWTLFEDIAAPARETVPGDRKKIIMLDAIGRYRALGDSSMLWKRSSAEKFTSTSKPVSHPVDLKSLVRMGNDVAYSYETPTEEDFNSLLALDPDNDQGWDAFTTAMTRLSNPDYGLGFIEDGERYLRHAVMDYLTRVRDNGDMINLTNFSGQAGGTCVGIVKAVPQGLNEDPQYIPIFVPRTAGNVVSGAVAISGSKATLSYIRRATFDNPRKRLTWKASAHSKVAGKGIAYARDDSLFPDSIDCVMNAATMSGRMKGRDNVILYSNLSGYMELKYMNLFWEDRDGHRDFTPAFKELFARHGEDFLNQTKNGAVGQRRKSFWDLLLENDAEAWAAMNLENCGLSNVETTKQNIIKAIRAADKYGIAVSSLFGVSSYSFEFVEDSSGDGTERRMVPRLVSINEVQSEPGIDAVFYNWAFDDICDFYAVVGQGFNLVASVDGTEADGTKPIFDRLGRMYIDDEIGYSHVLIDDFTDLGHESDLETPGNAASVSLQQRISKLMSYGYSSSSVDFVRAMSAALSDDARTYHRETAVNLSDLAAYDNVAMGGPLFANVSEYQMDQELEDIIKADKSWRRHIIDENGKRIPENLSESETGREILDAINELRMAFGIPGDLPVWAVHYLVNHQDGSTRGDFENEEIYAVTFIKHVNSIAENVRRHGIPILAREENGRFSAPTVDPVFVRWLCSVSSNLNYDEFVARMWEQEALALELIMKIPNSRAAQRTVLQRLFAALRKSWRDNDAHPWRDCGFVFGGLTVQEMTENDTVLTRIAERMGLDPGAFEPLAELGRRLMRDQRKRLENNRVRQNITTGRAVSNKLHVETVSEESIVSKRMDDIVTFSRMAAVANPGVVAGNLAGRAVSQSMMDALLEVGARANIGPFAWQHSISQDALDVALSDDHLFEAYLAIREMGVTGEDELLGGVMNSADFVTKLAESRASRSGYKKFATNVFSFANGGNFMMKQQMKIFFKRLINFIEAEPALSSYLEVAPNGMMFIENEIMKDPAGFFLSCFVPTGGRPELFVPAMQAMNSAMTGDMAQRHWLASFLHHALKDRPLGRFLFSTTICKFPRYQFNLVDKALNWFAPMSTLNYILTHAAAEWDERQAAKAEAEGREYTRFNFELDQRFVNAREAMAYDVAHLGPMVVAAVLLHVGNAIEPPDDEKKWGDPDEWLICGYRIGESWWISDLLGAFVPSILFTKSCLLGTPTSSLLVNGGMSACYGNPFLRAADVCDVLVSWNDSEDLSSYAAALEQYKDAEGGAPGFLDWIGSNSVSAAANLVTGTVTPSFVREWYRNSQQYEKSYKKIYKKTATGKMSESGEQGETQNTTYFDAQMRKACRNNPFLAIVMDLMNQGGTTGYLLSEMPDTVYYDDAQLDQMKYWSIKGLNEQQAEEKLSAIMLTLKTHSIDELQQSGFYLDGETLYALGSYMWDTCYSYDDQWNELGETGALSYTVLGNGNFDEGKKRYYELLNMKNAMKDEIKNLYYDKVKNSYLARGAQQYRRYTTSYRTDSEGNVYATGFHRQGVLPFVTAPGTLTNPEGTAGYENDFVSISAVTGEPMDQRALVPIPSEYTDLPSFAGFSEKGDGEGYSGNWSRYSGTKTKDANGNTEGLTYPDGSSIPTAATSGTKYSSGGGGGGGYTRRSSGGGSSYVPGISSRNYTPNTPNAAAARTSRSYDANLDYLRPNVETKGSRDAYKRGDM